MATKIEMAAARRLIADISYTPDNHSPTSGAFTAAAEAGGVNGWINGTVILHDGQVFNAGGGWIDLTGLVEPYNYRDAGEVDELAEALGLDIEDTLQLLREDCPAEWAIKPSKEDLRAEALAGESAKVQEILREAFDEDDREGSRFDIEGFANYFLADFNLNPEAHQDAWQIYSWYRNQLDGE